MKLKNKILFIFSTIFIVFLLLSIKTYAVSEDTFSVTIDKNSYTFSVPNLDNVNFETSLDMDNPVLFYFLGLDEFGSDESYGLYCFFVENYVEYDTLKILERSSFFANAYFKFFKNGVDVTSQFGNVKYVFLSISLEENIFDYTYYDWSASTVKDLTYTENGLNSSINYSIIDNFINFSTAENTYLVSYEGNEELVFQNPVESSMVGLISLETLRPTQVQEVIMETLKKIIPIVLMVFSALLSPFLIRYLICLRK